MEDIEKLRKKIDSIDNSLLKLLNQRAFLAKQIGKIKKKEGKSTSLFRPERQVNILRRLLEEKSNKLGPTFIINLWKNIFFFQTKLQGDIKYIIPKSLNKDKVSKIIKFLGENIEFYKKRNIDLAIEETLKSNNSILFLNYPSKSRYGQWWTYEKINSLYVNASIPFILEKKQSPDLVILSKNRPLLDDKNILLYVTNQHIKNKKLKLLASVKNKYLFESRKTINNDKLYLLGSYCNIDSSISKNEKN